MLPLASTVLRIGAADEPTLVGALAEHYGVPGADLGSSTISTEVLSMVPREVARSHRLLPASIEDETLQIVVADPGREDMLDEIAFATGRRTVAFVCLRIRIDETIEAAYEARANGEPYWRGPRSEKEEPHLEIISPVPEGASVSMDVDLPDEPFRDIDGESALPARADGTPPRALVVDDEVEILDLIERALRHREIEVVRATRGGEVLELLESTNPDVVLLDAMLPEIQGFDLCERIKNSARYKHIPVIMISAMAQGWNFAQDVRRLYGADAYLGKPFRVAELVRIVEEALERTKARERSPEIEQAGKRAAQECKRAAELYRSGAVEEALAAAQRAVVAYPFEPRAHFVLGTVLHAMGNIYQAISQYERVAELSPTLFSALKNLAVLYERQGFKAKAVEMWMRALEQSPSDAVRQTIKAHLFGLI